MASLLLFLTTIYLTVIAGKEFPKRSITDNEIGTGSNLDHPDRSWVTIKSTSDQIKAFPGQIIELECEAFGNIQPLIRFHKRDDGSYLSEIFSNEPTHSSPNKLVRAKARLSLVAKKSEVIFCEATGGRKTVRAPIEIFVSGTKLSFLSNDVFGYDMDEAISVRKSPKITFFDTAYLDITGSTAVLPCSTSGVDADVIWLNTNGKIIDEGRDDRFEMMASGSLKIKNIRWEDMGEYTCVVRNHFGKDSITTFLYPAMAEK